MQRTSVGRPRRNPSEHVEQAVRRRLLPMLRLSTGVRAIQRAVTRHPGCQVPWLVSVILCLAAAGGCRMCPDPFDYSGPVPNGSAPQNDFQARSTGNRPLNAAPRPWPPVVQADQDEPPPGPDQGPNQPSVLVASAADTGEDRVVPVVREAIEQATTSDTPAPAVVEPAPLEPLPAPGDLPTPAAPVAGPAVRLAQPRELPFAETPGWRPRR